MNTARQVGEGSSGVDTAGERWLVYELAGSSDDRPRSLVFGTEHVVRAVRNFPDESRTLAAAALLQLNREP